MNSVDIDKAKHTNTHKSDKLKTTTTSNTAFSIKTTSSGNGQYPVTSTACLK